MKTAINLTDEEIVSCLSSIERYQDLVIQANHRLEVKRRFNNLPERQRYFLSQIDEVAREDNRVVYYSRQIRVCRVCDKEAGYAKYTKNTRYHRKGDLNYDNPLYLRGYEFKKTSISFHGDVFVGCCSECLMELEEHIVHLLSGRKVSLPYQFIEPGGFRYQLDSEGNVVQIPYKVIKRKANSDEYAEIMVYAYYPNEAKQAIYTGNDIETIDSYLTLIWRKPL